MTPSGATTACRGPRAGADRARIRRNRHRGARIAGRIAREARCERSARAIWYPSTPAIRLGATTGRRILLGPLSFVPSA